MKLFSKLKQQIQGMFERFRSGNPELDASSLPTNDTLEDHRREILRSGKKHSRPLSTTQRKVVLISSIIAILLLFLVSILYIRSVYFKVSTSNFIASTARLVPTPVVKVGDQRVYYDSVIFHYNTALRRQAIEQGTIDTDQAFANAVQKSIQNTVIRNMAEQQQVTVTDEEVEAGISGPISLAGGEDTFEATLQETYGWNKEDFRREVRIQLLRSRLVSDQTYQFKLEAGADNFETTAVSRNLSVETQEINEDTEVAPEIADAVATLAVGQVSDFIYAEDGVYILHKVSDAQVDYVFESYTSVDQYIKDSIAAATVNNCLNRSLPVEGAVDVSWYSCLR